MLSQITELDMISNNVYDGATNLLLRTTDAANVTTNYEYDPDGRVKRVGITKDFLPRGIFGPAEVASGTEYDAKGRVIKTIDSYGKSTETHYDEVGNVLVTIDKFGGQTVNSYDKRGNLVRTDNPDGTETRSVYDEMGRVIWQTDRFASTSTFTFNKLTDTLTWTNQDNATTEVVTHTVYDSLGRVVATERYKNARIQLDADAGTNNAFESSIGVQGTNISESSTVYNEIGEVAETKDAAEFATGNLYYPNGQLQKSGPLASNALPIGLPKPIRLKFPNDQYSLTGDHVRLRSG